MYSGLRVGDSWSDSLSDPEEVPGSFAGEEVQEEEFEEVVPSAECLRRDSTLQVGGEKEGERCFVGEKEPEE